MSGNDDLNLDTTQAKNLRLRRGLIGVMDEAQAKVAVEVTMVRTTGPRLFVQISTLNYTRKRLHQVLLVVGV